MGGSDSAQIVARMAQRRVALLLLPLRVFLGIAWLRSGLAMILQPEWLDGTALTGFLHSQTADAPILLYTDVMVSAADRLAAPMGMAAALGQIAIGLGLITGTLTNLALLMAIVLNANLVLAGVSSPSQYFIVIQLVLLAGGAGSDYSVDRSLSRYLPSPLLTGRRGVVEGGHAPGPGLVFFAVTLLGLAMGLVVGGVVTRSSLLPDGGVDEPGYTVVALLGVTALLLVTVFIARRTGDEAEEPPTAADVRSSTRRQAPGPPPRQNTSERRPVPAGAPFDAPISGMRRDAMPPARPSAATPRSDVAPPRRPPQPAHPGPRRSAAPPEPVQPWPEPAPAMSPAGAGPARQDQPTTQFARPSRRRAPDRSDPYAELRDLPPN
jgi:thiosulfate dehydrogenase [quinone] large subunit